jgi:quercetin dioxygenase-like cupin family protein
MAKLEILIETQDVRVRIMTLESGQATAWHYHAEIADSMFCLDGPVAVEYRDPDARIELANGEHCDVAVKRVHRVVNLAPGDTRYLLVQGVGRYDFNAVEE